MTVLLFLPRFVEPIRAGTTCQTIRATARCKPEDVLSLRRWVAGAYRSKQQEIIPPVVCEAVRPVRIVTDVWEGRVHLTIAGHVLSRDQVATFVTSDGFKNELDFIRHWYPRSLHFEGFLIDWTNRPAEGGGA